MAFFTLPSSDSGCCNDGVLQCPEVDCGNCYEPPPEPCTPEEDYKWNNQDTVEANWWRYDGYGGLAPTLITLLWDSTVCGYTDYTYWNLLARDGGEWLMYDVNGAIYEFDNDRYFTLGANGLNGPHFEIL